MSDENPDVAFTDSENQELCKKNNFKLETLYNNGREKICIATKK